MEINESKLQNLVRSMLEKAMIDPKETSMVKVKRKEAFDKVAGLWRQLNFHFINLVVYGDSYSWRKEIKTFAQQIDSIQLKLKSRNKLTKEEHLDAMLDFRDNRWGKKYFYNAFQVISSDLGEPKRDMDQAQKVVYELQMKFLTSFLTSDKVDFDTLLNEVLSKYPELKYSGV